MVFMLPTIEVSWMVPPDTVRKTLRCAGQEEVQRLVPILLRSNADAIEIYYENEVSNTDKSPK